MTARPTAANLWLTAPQFTAGRMQTLEVAVHRRSGNRSPQFFGQNLVDYPGVIDVVVRVSERRLDREVLVGHDVCARDHHGASDVSLQSAVVESGVLLRLQCAVGNAFPFTVGQQNLLLAERFEKPSTLTCLNFVKQDRTQQRTPEDGPIIFSVIHFF